MFSSVPRFGLCPDKRYAVFVMDSIRIGSSIVIERIIGIKGRQAMEGIVVRDAVVTPSRCVGIDNMWGFIEFFQLIIDGRVQLVGSQQEILLTPSWK